MWIKNVGDFDQTTTTGRCCLFEAKCRDIDSCALGTDKVGVTTLGTDKGV